MESIEEKAFIAYPIGGGMMEEAVMGCKRVGFINGYTTRNDEVVKMIEDLMKPLNTDRPNKLSYDADCAKHDVLTTLLQTIKDKP